MSQIIGLQADMEGVYQEMISLNEISEDEILKSLESIGDILTKNDILGNSYLEFICLIYLNKIKIFKIFKKWNKA